MTRIILVVAAACMACGVVIAQGGSSSDRSATAAAPHSADSLPQDRHDGLSVSVDPYTEGARSRQKFGKADPLPVGILPIEIFLRNETAQAIRVDQSTIQLTVRLRNGGQQDIDWVAVQEVASAVAHPDGPPSPQARRFPIGIPSATDKKTDKLVDILKPLFLDVDVVPPMGVIHGFLFFDLNHDLSIADTASLYVPDVTNVPSNKQLMFFEVPLGKE
jgi:hypothetical protein